MQIGRTDTYLSVYQHLILTGGQLRAALLALAPPRREPSDGSELRFPSCSSFLFPRAYLVLSVVSHKPYRPTLEHRRYQSW